VLQKPLAAFPSWFLRITCDRCGKDRMLKAAGWRDRRLTDILRRMRHDGCGGGGRLGAGDHTQDRAQVARSPRHRR
jgi:hypothetical protein